MFKETIIFALVLSVGLVVCQHQEEVAGEQQQQQHQQQDHQQQQEVSTEAPAKSANGLKNGLIDLALIGAKGAQRLAQESRPTLDQLKKTVDAEAKSLGKRLQDNQKLMGAWNQLKSNKHFERATNSLKPLAKNVEEQYGKLSEKSKPLIDRAAAAAKPLIEQAKQKGQVVLAEHEARQAQLREQHKSTGTTQAESEAQE